MNSRCATVALVFLNLLVLAGLGAFVVARTVPPVPRADEQAGTLRDQLAAAEERAKKAEQERVDALARADSAEAAARARNADTARARTDLAEREAQLADARSSTDRAHQELKERDAQLADSRSELKASEARLAEARQSGERLAKSLAAVIAAAENRYRDKVAELQVRDAELAAAREQLSRAELKAAELAPRPRPATPAVSQWEESAVNRRLPK